MDQFMGEDLRTWMEIKRYKDKELSADQVDLIKENAALRAKVSFYESKLDLMVQFRETMA